MRVKWWKIFIAFLSIGVLVGTPGCFGKSPLTTSVVKWHSDLDWDKFAKEAIYLPLFMFVLPFTAIVDAFVVNAINFWEKDDPLAANALGIPPGTDIASLKWELVDTPDGPRRIALLAEPDASGKAPRIVVSPSEVRVEDRDGRAVRVARIDPGESVTAQDFLKGTEKT